ncbi:uncharacterized protein A1O9_11268 [Exophiala aquamarina CBS 119918]|uniref:Uncharacterized protein n=1 Tax=Exophiala aquamarina CBS 119918 TaxID=1182545 RepID=A0A072NZ42_9EURO|nr:uncharacterized protein A1O9_11268 [Exophiala aquamarina CBS 119918]KEF52851.1 hypothetical protein A1O9_11268 [Exophiala aquamarina CBS 119918]
MYKKLIHLLLSTGLSSTNEPVDDGFFNEPSTLRVQLTASKAAAASTGAVGADKDNSPESAVSTSTKTTYQVIAQGMPGSTGAVKQFSDTQHTFKPAAIIPRPSWWKSSRFRCWDAAQWAELVDDVFPGRCALIGLGAAGRGPILEPHAYVTHPDATSMSADFDPLSRKDFGIQCIAARAWFNRNLQTELDRTGHDNIMSTRRR